MKMCCLKKAIQLIKNSTWSEHNEKKLDHKLRSKTHEMDQLIEIICLNHKSMDHVFFTLLKKLV